MTRTLTDIQTSVRYFSRDSSIDLTTATNLIVSNTIYRGLVSQFVWPEFNRKAVLTSPTVADQENYQWTGEDFPTLLDVKTVEIKSLSFDPPTTSSSLFGVSSVTEPTARYTWKNIYKPPSEYEWDLAGRKTSVDTPQYYKRFLSNRHVLVAADIGTGTDRWHSVNDGSTWVQSTTSSIGLEVRYYGATDAMGTGATTATDANKLALRPYPSAAGYEIRVTGVEEPAEFTLGSSSTGFILSSADDSLAFLIAASMAARDGMNEIFQYNVQQATTVLAGIFGSEQGITEKIGDIV